MGKVIFWKRINYSINYFIIIIPIKTCFSTQICSHSHSSEKLTEVGPIFTFSSILYLPWSRLININNKRIVCILQTYKHGDNRIHCSFLNISFPVPEHKYSSAIIISTIRWNIRFDVKFDLDLVILPGVPKELSLHQVLSFRPWAWEGIFLGYFF